MQAPNEKDTAAPASQDPDGEARREPAREVDSTELSGEQVEDRIVPRLASNHNETFLVDL